MADQHDIRKAVAKIRACMQDVARATGQEQIRHAMELALLGEDLARTARDLAGVLRVKEAIHGTPSP